ncbi:MAG: hypothetical protein EAX86_02890 [Candidatus Heimdallarchaeota archaeon]|nr:hypothetical protein [Candidatus Heimdallarchaeota archaeon]
MEMTPDTEEKPNKTEYQHSSIELFKILEDLRDYALENRDELYKQLVTVEDALETLLNWIKLEKNSIRNFETILEWAENLASDKNISKDEVRYQLRTVLLPQVESFTQNLTTGEKSALKVLEAVNKDLNSLPKFLKDTQQQNFKLLTIVGYEPESKTSHLDLALNNLYQGRFQQFDKEIGSLTQNLQHLKLDTLEEEEE